MVHFSAQQVRNGFLVVGIPAAALAAMLWLRSAGQAHRPADPDSEQAAPGGDAEPSARSFVRLDRAELRAAAGIEVETVQSRPVESTITCTGSVAFNQNRYVKVPPKTDGTLLKILVDVGAKVRARDVLAVVNSQVVGDLKASYLKAQVHEEHLRWQLDRFKDAAEGVAAKNLIETRHLLEEELADTARIKSRLENYGFSPEQVARVAKDKDLGVELPVLAPRDGVIVERQAVEGEPVQTTTPLFAIADLETMWVHLHVYENQLRSIHLGQNVTFLPDGLPGQGFAGTVTWISPEIDAQTRTIQLRAEVANRDGALRANMYGTGALLVEQSHPRLVVPQGAVQSHDGVHIVFVQKPDNLFEVRRIEIGLKDERYWEVISGLEPGEKVATIGSFLLKSNLDNSDFGKVE
jgi:membrane fusion protein, heavy metal efflux system